MARIHFTISPKWPPNRLDRPSSVNQLLCIGKGVDDYCEENNNSLDKLTMAELSLDQGNNYLDCSRTGFMPFDDNMEYASTKLTKSVTECQESKSSSHLEVQKVHSPQLEVQKVHSPHQTDEGSRKNKYQWNHFNFYNSPTIPESDEDESAKVSTKSLTGPPLPLPLSAEGATLESTSSGSKYKAKAKPGSSLSAEVMRQQLTGAQFSKLSDLLNSNEVFKSLEKGHLDSYTLRKTNSLTDFDFKLEDSFRERTNSASSTTSLPPTPRGSPKQLRRTSSASTLHHLQSVGGKMKDNPTAQSCSSNALIKHEDHDLVPVVKGERSAFNETVKPTESRTLEHSDRTTFSRSSESLFTKFQKWSTTSQVKITNKDINAWAPGGF